MDFEHFHNPEAEHGVESPVLPLCLRGFEMDYEETVGW